ncbi:uncharacterized protein LOC132718176 [Ruditapes philippinarum]|uniref:uncharacterized protein LOC132718176 n=1 Tax=Ruditapes philippinarum TaxID=129788 RepID=UPI00295A5AB3|nr:uncharacterized protein LOC132718176 [Ruditapes philippinarum]XP_060557789.1 uncharacterized protein LOC132718176 [Ruditapes philippinarum]XP_060557791.1 uncharacterized protein LOC132718176 [Ruditapes philippinarum]XP_060557792.1 uncharacterized protein LOC132718176 [Ruditapes philippinarum]
MGKTEESTETAIDVCDHEQNDDASTTDYSCLDWNKVFRFLANQLDAAKCLLFFNTLYGNTRYTAELNSSARYKQVENDTKLRLGICDTITLLVEQFKAWKEYAGRNAKHTVISKSLQELDLNDTLHKFESFMCNPPMLLQKRQVTSHIKDDDFCISDQNHDVMSFPMPQVHLKRTFYAMEQSSCCQERRKVPDGVPDNVVMPKWCYQESIHQRETFPTTKYNTENPLEPDHEEANGLCREKKNDPHNESGESNLFTPSQPHLTMSSFWLLIRTFVLKSKEYLCQDMYQILLCDTISKVMTETVKKEEVILSLTYQDFLDAEKIKTKKETIAVMYSNEIRLVLGEAVFSDLSFYAEYARRQVIGRLGGNINKADKDYLFLNYNGNRMYSQRHLGNEKEEDVCPAKERSVTVQDTSTAKMEENQL